MKHMKPMDIMEIKKKLCTFFFLATHSEEKHCKPRKIKTQQKPTKIDHHNNPMTKDRKVGYTKTYHLLPFFVVMILDFFVILGQHASKYKT